MTEYTDLQKAAEYAAQDTIKFADEDEEMRALQQFHEEVDPETILALIADLDEARNGMKHSCAIRLKKRIELLETQRDQLIADNERLTKAVGLQVIRRFVGDDDQKKMDELVSAGIQVDKDRIAQLETERDQLKAENAGLRTGYEAYERVNAELKAENEGLREEIGGLKEVSSVQVKALKTLTFAARTTGGTAGPDEVLIKACEEAERSMSLGGIGRAYMVGADAALGQGELS